MTKQSRPGMITKKRKAGPGRKPAGPIRAKSSNFSTRITAQTRQALEAEARAAGQSISQVAEQLLRLGIDAKRKGDRSPPTRGFCYTVGELSELISNLKMQEFDWRTNPFQFEAFGLAIQKFMKTIKPAGDIRSPIEDEPLLAKSPGLGPFDTPQARADWAVEIIWHNWQSIKPEHLEAGMVGPRGLITAYGMARAKDDLRIELGRPRS
jgi:hypothetical protein